MILWIYDVTPNDERSSALRDKATSGTWNADNDEIHGTYDCIIVNRIHVLYTHEKGSPIFGDASYRECVTLWSRPTYKHCVEFMLCSSILIHIGFYRLQCCFFTECWAVIINPNFDVGHFLFPQPHSGLLISQTTRYEFLSSQHFSFYHP